MKKIAHPFQEPFISSQASRVDIKKGFFFNVGKTCQMTWKTFSRGWTTPAFPISLRGKIHFYHLQGIINRVACLRPQAQLAFPWRPSPVLAAGVRDPSKKRKSHTGYPQGEKSGDGLFKDHVLLFKHLLWYTSKENTMSQVMPVRCLTEVVPRSTSWC